MMRLLFLAPSRSSRGDASIAAHLARSLPRKKFQVGFVTAPDVVPQLQDTGMPTLPLTGGTPAGNLAVLDRIVRGFQPDCLVAADAFALHQSRGWSGLTVETLRRRYQRPVATIDRLGWQAAGYTADFYDGQTVRFPPLLDGYDIVIRTGPPHPVGPVPDGVTVAALHPSGLRDGGLRPPAPKAEDQPTVFLVTSPWEHRAVRSAPGAQLVDALPRLIHSHLAALGRRLRVVHVGPRQWRFERAEQIDYQHFTRLPYPMFQERLAGASLFLTTNVLSATLGQAVLAGVPALVLNSEHDRERLPDWTTAAAPGLRTAHPFHVAPLGWHRLLKPLLEGNPYRGCFAAADIFDRPAVLRAMDGLLDDADEQARLRQRQDDYRDQLTGLPTAGDALRMAVSR